MVLRKPYHVCLMVNFLELGLYWLSPMYMGLKTSKIKTFKAQHSKYRSFGRFGQEVQFADPFWRGKLSMHLIGRYDLVFYCRDHGAIF